MPPVSPQNSIGVNGKRQNKSASRICQGAASPSFGPLGRVSCWSPLGARPGVLHAPNPYLFSSHRHFRVWILLRFILSSNSIAVHRFVRPHFVINTVLIATSLFLLVFSVALAGVSLLGEVIRVTRVITKRSSGVVIARSRSFGALDHQRRDLHFNRLYLTSRKIGPNPLSSGISYQVAREVYSCAL